MAEERKVNRDARRVSPRGLVTLPPDAQRALGLDDSVTNRVSLEVGDGEVKITSTENPTRNDPRLSPGGLLQLSAEAHNALTGRSKGRYSTEYAEGTIVLKPAAGGK
jgi:hypothetical protein